MEKQTHTEVLSRKLSDRVKIQTTYQGRPDKGEEAPLDDASSASSVVRVPRQNLPFSGGCARGGCRAIGGGLASRRSVAASTALASKQETGAGQHPPSDPCRDESRVRAAMRIQAVRG